MKISVMALSVLLILSFVAVTEVTAEEMEKMPVMEKMPMMEKMPVMEKMPSSEMGKVIAAMESKEGYVMIMIDRNSGSLIGGIEGIKFYNSKGEQEQPEVKKIEHPIKIDANVQVLDSITWWKQNPTCIWWDGVQICK